MKLKKFGKKGNLNTEDTEKESRGEEATDSWVFPAIPSVLLRALCGLCGYSSEGGSGKPGWPRQRETRAVEKAQRFLHGHFEKLLPSRGNDESRARQSLA